MPDGSYNIALLNTGSSTLDVNVNWSDLGIKGSAYVRDMWSHQDLDSMDKEFTARLSTHAAGMIHVVPASSLTVLPENGTMEVNPSNVKLKWSAENGTDSYHVQVATDPDMKNVIFNQTVSVPTVNVKDLKKETHYYWKVSTVLGETEKQLGIYSFYTNMTTVPSTPDWVLADRNNKDSDSLTWNPTHGATSYTVYRKEINLFGLSSGSYQTVASNLTDPNYVDKNAALKTGATYSYKVTANNTIGESKKSIEAQSDDQSSTMMTALLIVLFTLGTAVIIFIITRAKSKSNRQLKLTDKKVS
jgi:hypothetical protein